MRAEGCVCIRDGGKEERASGLRVGRNAEGSTWQECVVESEV